MANTQFGIKHCNAVVSDYDKIKNYCPCMNCFGTGCDTCTVWNDVIKNSFTKSAICMGCKFHSGR